MPNFSTAFQDGKRVALPNGDVRWMMSGMGEGVTSAAELRPLWWVDNAALGTERTGRPVPFRGNGCARRAVASDVSPAAADRTDR